MADNSTDTKAEEDKRRRNQEAVRRCRERQRGEKERQQKEREERGRRARELREDNERRRREIATTKENLAFMKKIWPKKG